MPFPAFKVQWISYEFFNRFESYGPSSNVDLVNKLYILWIILNF